METLMSNDKVYRRCIEPDCGGEFYINARDQAFYKAKGLELPKRCYKCRKKNKADAASQIGGPPPERDQWEDTWSDDRKKS